MEFDIESWLKIVRHISLRYFILAFVSFAFCYLLFKKWMARKKIQPAFPQQKDYVREVLYSMSSMIIFATVAYVVVFGLKKYNHLVFGNFTALTWWQHLLGFVWMFLLHDAYFYAIHRLMHHPFLFKKIHLIHHQSTNPSPWTAYAFHPLEALLEAGIIPLVAFSFPVHILNFSLFMLFQILYNIYGHLGYELFSRKLPDSMVGKWINTSVAHNQHHKYFKGNYGLYTLFWDRILGTLRKDYWQAFSQYGKQEKPNQ
jgi:Delta7-sterol 5-desaturase